MSIIDKAKRYFAKIRRTLKFTDSKQYWIERYRDGRNSGAGSYGEYSKFKASVLNSFIRREQIGSAIEFGCGDGNQLTLIDYPRYLGLDVSPDAIARCRELFQNDPSKSFKLMQEYEGETAELALSLDVIYHLVEDAVFESYMHRLFDASTRFVIIYSSNTDRQKSMQFPHVRHRHFTDWVKDYMEGWHLEKHIPNNLYEETLTEAPPVDFFIYRKEV